MLRSAAHVVLRRRKRRRKRRRWWWERGKGELEDNATSPRVVIENEFKSQRDRKGQGRLRMTTTRRNLSLPPVTETTNQCVLGRDS